MHEDNPRGSMFWIGMDRYYIQHDDATTGSNIAPNTVDAVHHVPVSFSLLFLAGNASSTRVSLLFPGAFLHQWIPGST